MSNERDIATGRFLLADVRERFWAKVVEQDRGYATPCWIWQGARSGRGGAYPQFWMGGRNHLAHRVAYELLIGPIVDGLELDHLCRQTLCVRPLHLEDVTSRVNVLRSGSVAAINARLATCRRGHPFTGTWRGRRTCRPCSAIRTRAQRERRAAA